MGRNLSGELGRLATAVRSLSRNEAYTDTLAHMYEGFIDGAAAQKIDHLNARRLEQLKEREATGVLSAAERIQILKTPEKRESEAQGVQQGYSLAWRETKNVPLGDIPALREAIVGSAAMLHPKNVDLRTGLPVLRDAPFEGSRAARRSMPFLNPAVSAFGEAMQSALDHVVDQVHLAQQGVKSGYLNPLVAATQISNLVDYVSVFVQSNKGLGLIWSAHVQYLGGLPAPTLPVAEFEPYFALKGAAIKSRLQRTDGMLPSVVPLDQLTSQEKGQVGYLLWRMAPSVEELAQRLSLPRLALRARDVKGAEDAETLAQKLTVFTDRREMGPVWYTGYELAPNGEATIRLYGIAAEQGLSSSFAHALRGGVDVRIFDPRKDVPATYKTPVHGTPIAKP